MNDRKPEREEPEEAQERHCSSGEPDRSIELTVKKHPEDADAKVDLGSDESMDASDPSSVTQPGNSSEPAPSSGYPQSDEKK